MVDMDGASEAVGVLGAATELRAVNTLIDSTKPKKRRRRKAAQKREAYA